MKILVTGGAGFIGSHFVRHILATYSTYTVTNLDALTYAGNLENLTDIEADPRYRFVHGSVVNREIVFEVMRDIDAVVHFAAESHVDRSILDPSEFIRTNVLGTQTLLDAAHTYGKRFHHISTDEVFGSLAPDEAPFTEQSPYRPRSPYAASKAAADHLVRAYHETYGVAATISNCSNNYGPYMFPEKIIPLFITNLLEGKKVPLYGDGHHIRDWIHVADHMRGVDMILHQGKIGETYCLGGGMEVSNRDLAAIILRSMGKNEQMIEYVPDRPGHDERYAINFSKIKKELGWEPRVRFADGIQGAIEWYQTHQAWVAHCKNGAYREYYKRQYNSPGVL